jgi:adenylate kinase
MTISLVGLPGCGKSTQSKMLAEHFGIVRLETGELFRKVAQQDTDLGRRIAATMARGDLVEEADMNLVLSDLFHEMSTSEPVLVDGFPRDLQQAKMYRKHLDKCYFLDVEDEIAIERLLKRKRADDTPHVVNLRIQHFRERTEPMINWLEEEGILETINASGTPETIFENMAKSLGRLIGRD